MTNTEPPKSESAKELRKEFDERTEWYEALYAQPGQEF